MGDEGDYWREHKEWSQNKRAKNRFNGAERLTKEGIPFESKNNGAHLIVEDEGAFVDYWPGTGRWNARDGVSGFGIKNLLGYLRRPKQPLLDYDDEATSLAEDFGDR